MGLGGAGVLSSCNLGEGYADFGDDVSQPELVVIDGPGTKIADGQLSNMLVDPWGDKGAVVVGFRYLEDGPYLRMQPFDGSKGCNVGRAYRCIVFNRLPNEPQYIAYLDDIQPNNRGTLYFTDHDCNVVYGGIEDAELPERLFDSPPGFVIAAGSQLLEIEPFRKKKRVITDNLRVWVGPGKEGQIPIWYIADGQLVVLDDARQEVLRLGKNVTEVVFEAADPTRGLFLVDEGNLTRYVEATGTEPKTIATNVCGASLGGYGISYRSPCAEGRVVIQDLDDGAKYEVDSGVKQLFYAQLRPRSDGSGSDLEAVYSKPSAVDVGYDELWLKQAGVEPRVWKSRLGRFISATTNPNPTLTAIVESDGVVGKLIRVDSKGERTLCENVAIGYSVEAIAGGWVALTDVVDGFGTLIWFDDEGNRRTVAERVGLASIVKTPERDDAYTGVTDAKYYNLRALLTENETGFGRLTILDRTKLFSPKLLGKSIPNGRFEFFRNMTAVGYLDDYDEESDTGALKVYQTRIGVTSAVAKGVNEFSELLWPYQGVIYSVKKGDSYSIWAARAKP